MIADVMSLRHMNQIQDFIQIVNDTVKNVADSARTLIEAAQKAAPVAKQIAAAVEKFPEFFSDKWIKHAHKGWYPNWYTPAFSSLTADGDLDGFMTSHLVEHLDSIESKLIELYPDRTEILAAAFKHHRDDQFIASIPIFFAQADGICNETINAMLLAKHKSRQNKIDDKLSKTSDLISHVVLPILAEKTQMGESLDKASEADKELGPNRNGILHGSSLHLDYGKKINSLKSISLLAFVAATFENADIPE